jgi:hypothetical protein
MKRLCDNEMSRRNWCVYLTSKSSVQIVCLIWSYCRPEFYFLVDSGFMSDHTVFARLMDPAPWQRALTHNAFSPRVLVKGVKSKEQLSYTAPYDFFFLTNEDLSQVIIFLSYRTKLVVRLPGYIMEMYCDSCEVRTEFINAYVLYKKENRLCGLVVRVPGSWTETFVIPVRYELNLCMLCRRKQTASVI